ncbi:glutamate--tRNA ligase [Candidatus Woesearchaeota archaeon]|nr:glutamate--tRNA ligase [Candidatus Woesearchaeota archaeon]MCF7901146.1 glutamate--tRNA ligase [Candidatus Woesearchaeota archaeon]MCF8013677.1 glutamate--tRNA ligase [Candidatus Woesearchaeota archaeon]
MDFTDDIINTIRKLALLNAVKHNGKAVAGGVIGGLLGDFPDLKSDMKSVSIKVNEVLKEVNGLTLDVQTKELLEIDPDALESKHKEHDIFDFLGIKEGEKVVTAFPPGPEKYPHMGHAKACLVNYLLAKKYGGKFILRFEDTNPDLVKEEFYGIMQEDFKWLGVSWDDLVFASDHMDLYYKHFEELIDKDKVYVCSCVPEDIKKGRENGEPCICRNLSKEDTKNRWEEMKISAPGSYIARLKIDLKHKNSTMRDPTAFRILTTTHARQGDKYRVWPNYDFQNSIMDGFLGVTHRIRSKEFEMRNELQRYLQNLLGYSETNIFEFGRFNLKGVESSGRIIREKVNSGELIGWDDPSLTTLRALKRRGFLAEAIKNFVVSTGITKNEPTLTWDDLIMHNKRLLDEDSDRYFFVANPVEIKIENAPQKEFELNLHPSRRRGGRNFVSDEFFFISKKDYDDLEENTLYRFMECFNFKYLAGSVFEYVDDSIDTYKKSGECMMHFLPKKMDLVDVEILMPDKSLIKGFGEPSIINVDEDDIVQFERFGFCRLDDKSKLRFWFTH